MSLLNDSVFVSTPPALSLDEIQAVVHKHYGLKISPEIVALGSERDQNVVICVDGKKLVFRVTNGAESPDVTHLQTSALMHVQRTVPNFPIQHVVPTLDGRTEARRKNGLGSHVVRLMTYLDGIPMSSIRHRSTIHREKVGEVLGQLALALKGFAHPSSDHDLIWNVVKASQVRELLEKIDSPERRSLASHFLSQFEKHAANQLHLLRSQVIHNDLNPHNILFDCEASENITGVLDFGDIILGPIIVDVAVAASSQMISTPNPLEGPGDVIRGFNSVLVLRRSELDLVFDLMAARLVLNVAITGWRASLYPGNRDYILKNNQISWDTLEAFVAVDRRHAAEYFKSICLISEDQEDD